MGIDNKTITTERLEKTTIEITEVGGVLSAVPAEAEVGPGDLVEWLANLEFVLDFKGKSNSPVSYGQYQFASMDCGGRHRVALVTRNPGFKSRFDYDIRTAEGVLDPALIIDPNRLRRPGIA